jgi:hypothetical protein
MLMYSMGKKGANGRAYRFSTENSCKSEAWQEALAHLQQNPAHTGFAITTHPCQLLVYRCGSLGCSETKP